MELPRLAMSLARLRLGVRLRYHEQGRAGVAPAAAGGAREPQDAAPGRRPVGPGQLLHPRHQAISHAPHELGRETGVVHLHASVAGSALEDAQVRRGQEDHVEPWPSRLPRSGDVSPLLPPVLEHAVRDRHETGWCLQFHFECEVRQPLKDRIPS